MKVGGRGGPAAVVIAELKEALLVQGALHVGLQKEPRRADSIVRCSVRPYG